MLQERELERVGDHRPIAVDVRVIAATHKNLRQLIRQGLFREDLYYRIGVIPIHLPPLRERKADIPLLIEIFRKRLAGKTGKKIAGISKDALDLLANYSWPGNVRELLNTLEYAFVLCPGGRIGLQHLPEIPTQEPLEVPPSPTAPTMMGAADAEKQQLIEALQNAGGNQCKAARLLGVSRVTVWKRIKKYGVACNTIAQARK